MKLTIVLPATIVAAALGTPALAGQANAVMQVRAEVVESCSASAGHLEFALDAADGAKALGQAAVVLSCDGPAAYEIALDAGQNGVRRMVDPASGATLAYEIYSDAARSLRWGNTRGSDTVAGMADADGKAVLTAYGATLGGGERLPAGTYADAVVVTVDF
ncbi:Csu type fimbrial protein [Qipengyuania qiaonensis]|uniref:Spore coat U domain-containing protein n=1 Tax=Qipengyuania qiaonensis TaxID=2867240 RepID=A0ABS7J5I5_9SPHN|nr:spore coat U domain-containing protein [Qipengyuania qiaonensis]MBX7482163.1 spore coat U domain-containing protein [Qipengyuania qiaonensis]